MRRYTGINIYYKATVVLSISIAIRNGQTKSDYNLQFATAPRLFKILQFEESELHLCY